MAGVKEQRFLRSKRLRAALWASTNGRCAICGVELGEVWHADHVVPWSVKQETNVHAMQPLCGTCNLKKGSSVEIAPLIDVAQGWALGNENDPKHRPGHLTALEDFAAWVKRGCPTGVFSMCAACRYGKSDMSRCFVVKALELGVASAGVVVHPYPSLSRQFIDPVRMKSWQQRWLPDSPGRRIAHVQRMPDFAKNSMCDGQWLGSIHIQALLQPMQLMLCKEWVRKQISDHGVPPMFVFDEAHQFSRGNRWGEIARELRDLGCPIVVMTATPFRNDGDDVFGFHKQLVEKSFGKTKRYSMPVEGDPTKREIHTTVRDESEYEIRADTNITFQQAWAESAIAKCSIDLIDWNMTGCGKADGETRLLSELPVAEVRKKLPELYRDPEFIAEAVRRTIKHIKAFRQSGVKDATAIFYGMDDHADSGVPSENQKAIKAELARQDPSMIVGIATMATDGDGEEKSETVIRKFVDPNTKHYDALVLKQMGAAGLDSDRICVVVLWNTTRSLGQMIQMAMRGGNASNKSHFVVIGLADAITNERLAKFIDDSGGTYVESIETDHEVEIVDAEGDEGQDKWFVPERVADTGMMDSDGRIATYEELGLALAVIAEFPMLFSQKTFPELADSAKRLGIKPVSNIDDLSFEETTEVCERLGADLNRLAGHIARMMFSVQTGRPFNGADKFDRATLGRLKAEANRKIKEKAGCFESWDKSSKDRCQQPSVYRKWYAAASAIKSGLEPSGAMA